MYQRTLSLNELLQHRSVFLFGARQTGKSTLLKAAFPEARTVDLLAADTFRQLSSAPESLRRSLRPNESLIVIDEVQKLPALLDEVHLMIEADKGLRFILTGSSARKLRRGGANLLAGRAHTRYLFPLTTLETPDVPLARRLQYGGLPSVIDSPDPWADLQEYVGVYLQEEIRAESLTRSIEAFSRFLTVAGLANGEQLNFTKIGNDAQVPPRTVREFFSVLEDTLIGFALPACRKTRIRKPVASAKFYLFDLGVAHALQQVRHLAPGTPPYGRALEHLVATELRACLSYRRLDHPLTYWRSTSQLEVDFVIGTEIGIEVKSTGRVRERDAAGLIALGEELPLRHRIIVAHEHERSRLDSGVEVIPVAEFLKALWQGAFF